MKFKGSHATTAHLCVLALLMSTPRFPCKSQNPPPQGTKLFSFPTALPLWAQPVVGKGNTSPSLLVFWRCFCSFFSPKQPLCHTGSLCYQLGLHAWGNGQAILMNSRLPIFVISSNRQWKRIVSWRISKHKTEHILITKSTFYF